MSSKLQQKKYRFKSYTEKLRKKKLEFVRFGSRTGLGSGSIIPETDPPGSASK